MSRILAGLLLSCAVAAAATSVPVSGERRLNFNDGWKFFKGEHRCRAPRF